MDALKKTLFRLVVQTNMSVHQTILRTSFLIFCSLTTFFSYSIDREPCEESFLQIGFNNSVNIQEKTSVDSILLNSGINEKLARINADIESIHLVITNLIEKTDYSLKKIQESQEEKSYLLKKRNEKIIELTDKIISLENQVVQMKEEKSYYVPEFKEDIGLVKVGCRYLYIDSNLNPLPSKDNLRFFDEARLFQGGEAIVRSGGSYRRIDRSLNEIENSKLPYDFVGQFRAGWALVFDYDHRKNRQIYGFIATNYQLMGKLKFLYAEPFTTSGTAPVQLKKRKWGLIDTDGNFILKGRADHMTALKNSEGYALIRNKRGDPKRLLISRDGRLITGKHFKHFGKEGIEFSEGLIVVKNGKGWYGFMDMKGNYLTSTGMQRKKNFPFYNAKHFRGGFAVVGDANNNYGYINKSGRLVNPGGYTYTVANSFENGVTTVADATGDYFIIDNRFQRVNNNIYSFLSDIHNGNVLAIDKGFARRYYYLMDISGRRICPLGNRYSYEEFRGELEDGAIAVKSIKNQRWGILNIEDACNPSSFNYLKPSSFRFYDEQFEFTDVHNKTILVDKFGDSVIE